MFKSAKEVTFHLTLNAEKELQKLTYLALCLLTSLNLMYLRKAKEGKTFKQKLYGIIFFYSYLICMK